MTYTAHISSMIAAMRFDDLPDEVIAKTKLLVLDQLGCMIAGSARPEAAMMTSYIAGTDSGGPATVFGTSHRFSPANAAHANGHATTILSLDDSFIRFGHPGNAVIPVALAVGEQVGASGPSMITAIVAGYEMSMRLGMAIQASEERDQQVKGYASWQIFGAATAAAKLHGLGADDLAKAYGLTAMHAPQPFLRKFYTRPMNWLKNNYGWANRGGITAIDLALAGFHGNPTIFDDDTGFWAMAGSDQFDPEQLLLPLAQRRYVMEIGFKPYGTCRWSHTAIDCVRNLMDTHGVAAVDVERVTVETVSEFVRDLAGDWPTSNVEAILHLPYAVALELHDQSSALGVREQTLADPALRRTADIISLVPWEGADEKFFKHSLLPTRVTLHLKNGRSVNASSEIPSGHPDGPPFGEAEVSRKYEALTGPVIGDAAADQLREAILTLETVSNLSAMLTGQRVTHLAS